ncbi:MAG: ATP-binding protein [Balneolaceae bacterium]
MKSNIKNTTWLLAALFLIIAVTYALFELSLHQEERSESEETSRAENAVLSAAQSYSQFEYSFAQNSRSLSRFIKNEIESGSSGRKIFNAISQDFNFWGVSIFENQDLWLWSGFGEQQYSPLSQSDTTGNQFVTVRRQNNVTFLNSQVPFTITHGDSVVQYEVLSRVKIQQNNILPIGQNVELNPTQLFHSENDFPVYFSFFESLPQNVQFKTTLSTQNVDSVGVIYTLAGDQEQFVAANQSQNHFYRAIFHVLLILAALLFLISLAKYLPAWDSLLLKLLAISIAWLFLSNIEFELQWIEIFPGLNSESANSLKLLLSYCSNAFFALLVTITSFNTLSSSDLEIRERTRRLIPGMFVLFGVVSAFMIYFFISETYLLFVNSSISLMDLNIFPSWDALVLYLSAGIFSLSVVLLLCLSGWFLLQHSHVNFWISLLNIILGFALGIFMLQQLSPEPEAYYWMIETTSISFLVVLLFTGFFYYRPRLLENSSPLRLLLLFGFISVCGSYVAMYEGYSERLNNQMAKAAESFIDEEASKAERIVRNLLLELEKAVSGLTAEDLNERPSFVESFFIQQTQQVISEESESFSISTQLVNNTGEIISEYASDLDSPGWTRAFDMLSLEIPFEEERIRINNLRPIVRERPLNEANSNYSSFRRAWIPLYEVQDSRNRIGWILCSVYRERPQFEKPLRAVMATEGSENWSSTINITEYINGISARKSIVGVPLELPGYSRLPQHLQDAAVADSIHFRTQTLGDEEVRELFLAISDNQIIRAATSHAGFENHLFSVLRFFFCVLIGGLFMLAILAWAKDVTVLGHNLRFRDRLIDRFILASLLCLMILTAASYYAINKQNEKNVRDQLLDKVGNLAQALSQQATQSAGESRISLNQLSSTLDSDASLYTNETLDISTTTQIYGQHLLPRLLPWDVHESIYVDGSSQETRKVTLGNQDLLIGYQPWINDEGEIAGVVAIPTFLKAPIYNEQLLSTTSYLLGIYVVIFGLFILGAAIISTQLTTPLHSLREGLKKISSGDLETTLPVRSKDEIGSLTNAYNIMVYRLKALQKDLSKAEREAAWKEMAQQVAHEIKNPLTPMKLNLQHLERQLKKPDSDFIKMKPQIEKIAGNMIEQIESLNQIASDFSKFAQPIDQQFQRVELNELLKSIAELYAPEKDLTIKTDLYSGEIWVSGVKEELRRVLINLVKNAYEAIHGNGTITLGSMVVAKHQKASIIVVDEGEGIPVENYESIFVPNFSTKSSGTGLGLAITKKIIEEHDGEISFSSAVGEGTTFTISLPFADKKPA